MIEVFFQSVTQAYSSESTFVSVTDCFYSPDSKDNITFLSQGELFWYMSEGSTVLIFSMGTVAK